MYHKRNKTGFGVLLFPLHGVVPSTGVRVVASTWLWHSGHARLPAESLVFGCLNRGFSLGAGWAELMERTGRGLGGVLQGGGGARAALRGINGDLH
jgi:hypothetical protein